jgi:phage terminase large subunit-like protein
LVVEAPPQRVVKPQPGLQTAALSSPADVAILGGAAGAGKTFSLLLEPIRHIAKPGFGAVFFRRESPQITNQGGLWDESSLLYPSLDAIPNRQYLSWTFPPFNTRVRFASMQYADDRHAWDGAQIPLIGFDQLESFEEIMFWYMFSRNRSLCGVSPYIRATCNPVPEDDETGGWLHTFISWWIDQETGYAIKERSGKLRWFVRLDETLHWADTRQELIDKFGPDAEPKSLTFIAGSLADNPLLTKRNPSYRANLLAMPLVERERLLGGNWKIKPEAGKVFNRSWFKTIGAWPTDIIRLIRYWDKAGTQDGGKYTAGALMGIRSNRRFVLLNVVRGQWSAGNREAIIKQTADADAAFANSIGVELTTWVEQEPGSGGKESAENTVLNLAGHEVRVERVTGSKLSRATPLAVQVEAGNVEVVSDLGPILDGKPALEAFLTEAQNFNGTTGTMDQIDAAGGAFNKLTLEPLPVTDATWGR